jgi:beta-glucanase (GH16 family)
MKGSTTTLLLSLIGIAQAYPIPKPIPRPAAGVAAVPPGFRSVIFYDDFSSVNEAGPPTSSKWTIDLGTSYPGGPARWGTNEVQTYTRAAANLGISGGNLLITPQLDGGRTWTSARIETTAEHDFSCLAGQKLRMEARIKIGDAPGRTQQGIWPAFWSLGSRYRGHYQNWPEVGEIDILESPNGESRIWHTVHCGRTTSGGPCKETTGLGSSAGLSRGVFHTLATEIDRTNAGGDWTGETITWFVDGAPTFVLRGSSVGDRAAWSSLAHASRFLLLNVAVGGSFPDAIAGRRTPDASTTGGRGAAMEVEYVGVFTT